MTIAWMMLGGRKANNVTNVVLVNNTAKTIDVSPGTAKRWLFLKAKQNNPDNVARDCYAEHMIATTILGNVLIGNALTTNLTHVVPSPNHAAASEWGGVGFLWIIEGAEFIRWTWLAGGASAGATDADGLTMEVMEVEI